MQIEKFYSPPKDWMRLIVMIAACLTLNVAVAEDEDIHVAPGVSQDQPVPQAESLVANETAINTDVDEEHQVMEEVTVTPGTEVQDKDEQIDEIMNQVAPYRIPPPTNQRNPADKVPVYTPPPAAPRT